MESLNLLHTGHESLAWSVCNLLGILNCLYDFKLDLLDGLLHALNQQFPFLLAGVQRLDLPTLKVELVRLLDHIHESCDFLQLDLVFLSEIFICLLEDFEEKEVFFWEERIDSFFDKLGPHIVFLWFNGLIQTDILLDCLKIFNYQKLR